MEGQFELVREGVWVGSWGGGGSENDFLVNLLFLFFAENDFLEKLSNLLQSFIFCFPIYYVLRFLVFITFRRV